MMEGGLTGSQWGHRGGAGGRCTAEGRAGAQAVTGAGPGGGRAVIEFWKNVLDQHMQQKNTQDKNVAKIRHFCLRRKQVNTGRKLDIRHP